MTADIYAVGDHVQLLGKDDRMYDGVVQEVDVAKTDPYYVELTHADYASWVSADRLTPVDASNQPAEVAPGALVPVTEVPVTTDYLLHLIQTPTVPQRYRESPTGVADMAAVIRYGEELGVGMWTSLQDIFLVGGQASMTGKLMSALIHNAGHQLRMKFSAKKVTVTCFRRDPYTHELVEVGEVDYGEADAITAGLSDQGTYQKFPRIMWGWRAISMAARFFYADVIHGVGYVPDELGIEAPVEAIPLDDITVEYGSGGEAIMDQSTAEILEAMPGDGEVIYDSNEVVSDE